ncbi:DNA-binding domain-containing protein [Sphingomonas yantingensis]|uniref:Putative DNA-binding domain-containing protein n=1 Tax=Sphingomonas yantingensis TaxID=1241761 RepID=A0A7W9EKC5_9SPHN|nr:DNA-binding domain-containing protein [Sphingomonas yantingensis]MBB5699885.1 hypothetical protein [Sphingomonas yantingensis]
MMLVVQQRAMRDWLRSGCAAGFDAGAAPGLAVYRNNHRAALVACLEAGFPRTRAWIGDDAFLDTVIDHVGRVPPSSWTLDAYGEDFPVTLALRYPDDLEVAEIAAIELALDRAFIGPDASVVGIDRLAGYDWDRAVLHITPTLELLEGATNAFELWELLSAGAMPPAAARLDTPRALFVWRQAGISRIRIADPIEAQALCRVRAGLPFGDLCTHTAEAFGPDEGISRAGVWLGRWITDGLVCAIDDDRSIL